MDERAEAVVRYWFGEINDAETFPEDRARIWFEGDESFDAGIRERFSAEYAMACEGRLDDWAGEPLSCLALILMLDQFSRNLYRDDARAYEQDGKALRLALKAVEKGFDRHFFPVQRAFFYMPLEHAEAAAIQDLSVRCFEQLVKEAPPAIELPMETMLDFARRHQQMIQRFGRFPYRNKVLSRVSTPGEEEFLRQPGGWY